MPFERGLRPRNQFLGEASEGAVEAPSDYLEEVAVLVLVGGLEA